MYLMQRMIGELAFVESLSQTQVTFLCLARDLQKVDLWRDCLKLQS